MEAAQSRPPKIPALTGLRFIAAMSVLVAHAVDQAFAPYAAKQIALATAHLAFFGMSLFFVLSGTVLAINYSFALQGPHKGTAVWNFAVARFARIVPLYYFCGIVFFAATPWSNELKAALPSYFLLTQSWTPCSGVNAFKFMVFYPHSWSISTEWFFYLLFPLVCLGTTKLRSSRSLGVAFVASIVGFAFLFYAYRLFQVGGIDQPGSQSAACNLKWFSYFSPFGRFCEFVLGTIVGQYILLRQRGGDPRLTGRASGFVETGMIALGAIGVLAAGVLATPKVANVESIMGYGAPSLLLGPFVALIVTACATGQGPLNWLMSSRFLQWGGDLSYSLYLLHPMLVTYFQNPFVDLGTLYWIEACLRVTVMVLLNVLIAAGSYSLIEVPSRAFFRRLRVGNT